MFERAYWIGLQINIFLLNIIIKSTSHITAIRDSGLHFIQPSTALSTKLNRYIGPLFQLYISLLAKSNKI